MFIMEGHIYHLSWPLQRLWAVQREVPEKGHGLVEHTGVYGTPTINPNVELCEACRI